MRDLNRERPPTINHELSSPMVYTSRDHDRFDHCCLNLITSLFLVITIGLSACTTAAPDQTNALAKKEHEEVDQATAKRRD